MVQDQEVVQVLQEQQLAFSCSFLYHLYEFLHYRTAAIPAEKNK